MSLSTTPLSVPSPLASRPSSLSPAVTSGPGKLSTCAILQPLCFLLVRLLQGNALAPYVAAALLAAGGLGLSGQSALAQRASVIRDANTGAVDVDQNAFDIRTGPLTNTSNIPLPKDLPLDTQEGRELPVGFVDGQLAPNSLDITTNYDFVERSFNDALNGPDGSEGPQYSLQRDSLKTTTRFNLNYVRGDHKFAEGIQVTVLNADGSVKSTETKFVRGDGVTRGTSGEELGETEQITVTYGIDEQVELRILNLRNNSDTQPTQSGVYFTKDGQIIAEDLPDGGDKDFDDGEYVDLPGGSGEAEATEVRTDTETETTEDSSPLDPLVRRDENNVETNEETVVQRDEEVEETVLERGEIDVPNSLSTRLGHAVGLRTENDELLVYDRYSAAGEVRVGSDGLTATGQLRPLFSNPSAPPTLLTGGVNFDPFADDNEAGFSTTLGITQYLSRTHRLATDAFGNVIENPNPDGPKPLEPTGLFNNRRMVGYVPGGVRREEPILSSNGVFELPQNQRIVVEPPNSQAVGRGKAAYTDNVGGLLIESPAGALTFVPQWTNAGYAQSPLELEAGSATRIIYALVPQQAGQNIQLGQTYAVDGSAGDYRIADGNLVVIAADQNPDNFYQESTEVYTVEDTLPTINNAANSLFNGIPGVYIETPGGDRIPTVDPNIPAEADARVGNELFPDVPGQRPYARTTRAGGLYIGGSLSGGFGNQRDILSRTTSTFETQTDQLRTIGTVNLFETPRNQVVATTTETTTTTQRRGNAFFNIDGAGLLEAVRFDPTSDPEVIDTDSTNLDSTTRVELGEESAAGSESFERVEVLNSNTTLIDQDSSTRENSYTNFSPLGGEIALGGVFNFGNTPWSQAANLVRAEIFAGDTIIGRSSNGADTGWRAELLLHPFGEVQRDGYQYDEAGNVVPLYQTEPALDADGNRRVEMLTAEDGSTVEMLVSQFVIDDETGDRAPQRVGTGRPKGPGVYVRAEGAFDGDDDTAINGGVQFSF
ncbi:MAG: hypothetical protein WBA76_11875 [Phormidesmis sp.]